jgi:hypothetical protein
MSSGVSPAIGEVTSRSLALAGSSSEKGEVAERGDQGVGNYASIKLTLG